MREPDHCPNRKKAWADEKDAYADNDDEYENWP